MARYPSSSHSRRRGQTRRWTYIISVVLVVAAAFLIIASVITGYPFGKTKDQTVPTPEAEPRVVVMPKPAPPDPNLSEIAPEPTAELNPEAAELIAEAMKDLIAKPSRIIEARVRLNEALAMPVSALQRTFVKKQLSELADKWLFSRTIFPQDTLCSTYKVKPGDQLRTIGRQFKVPWEILKEINKIPRAEALQAGETIKVINGPFHTRVYRSTFTMDLYLQNTFVKSFSVGLGKPGMETPTGLWLVQPGEKLISPTWRDPDTAKVYHPEDPNYPLGSRWIGLKGLKGNAEGRTGFAIHGTKDPAQIGTPGSRGCIRVRNGDVILLYNLLEPSYSQVEVVE